MKRRTILSMGAAVAALGAGTAWWHSQRDPGGPAPPEPMASGVGNMRLRQFGTTSMKVSEVGFGSWAIGGQSYGAVDKAESLNALARAEELGCNFVDTALVYGDSEAVLGEFLEGRRSRWLIATKYSGQEGGLTATVEQQLRNLRTDVIDFYQIHWMPVGKDEALFDEMQKLKQAGKVRYTGVSLYNQKDIERLVARPDIDGFQVAFSLLDPDPFLARVRDIRASRKGVIIRSSLREGFLTGKFKRDTTFPDPADQRHELTREDIARLVDRVERFRFLEAEAGSMAVAAARYPLSFPEVSTVILGTKNVAQADSNFGRVPGAGLSPASLDRIRSLQVELGLGDRWSRLMRRFGMSGA
jgi:aryl-alcohol dehydrogenase-like predicted oxidoreductase